MNASSTICSLEYTGNKREIYGNLFCADLTRSTSEGMPNSIKHKSIAIIWPNVQQYPDYSVVSRINWLLNAVHIKL